MIAEAIYDEPFSDILSYNLIQCALTWYNCELWNVGESSHFFVKIVN
jgi:hypothetical protein